MKPLANEKTCSNSAIGLEIGSATCVGDASKSRGKAKPQVGSHTAKKSGHGTRQRGTHARSNANVEGRAIASFTPSSQRPIDAFLPHMHKILGRAKAGPGALVPVSIGESAMLTSCCQPISIEAPSCGIVHL